MAGVTGLVTSQNVTAPKHILNRHKRKIGLVTSQNVTAPKPLIYATFSVCGLVTSQNVTAPKLCPGNLIQC